MSSPNSPHIVQRGETLFIIAEQHGVTVSELLSANPDISNPNLILVGQQVMIPAQPPPEATPPPSTEDDGGLLGSDGPNAVLSEFQPGGASERTAAQDHLSVTGVAASERMAATDRQRVMRHKDKFVEAARRFGLPPALLAAIASRESRGGNVLDRNGEGDNGNAFGLMQVDKNHHNVVRAGGPFGQPHINQATGILRDKLKEVAGRFANLSPAQQLETAMSRYNGGHGLPAPGSDEGTTGGDYMNDVWARARFYARVEQWAMNAPTAIARTPTEAEASDAHLTAVAPIDPRHKTDRVHPALRQRLGQLAVALAKRGMMALITDGLRTFPEQHALFLIGRRHIPGERVVTNADAGESNHNYGLAVDLYPVIDGKVFTDIPSGAAPAFKERFRQTQQAIIDEAERLGLTSGVHFTNLADTPHVQLLGENVLRPRKCLEIFRAHNDDLNAVWEEASRLV